MVLVNKTQYRDVLDQIRSRANEQGGGCSVVIFVAPECDAMCACHILTYLLRCEHVQYKIKPASGMEDLKRANAKIIQDGEIRSIVLINCAGTFDVSRVFDVEKNDLHCYIIDSHRPIHLANIYDRRQRIFVLDDTLETIRSEALPGDDSDLSANEIVSSSDDDDDDDSALSDSSSSAFEEEEEEYVSDGDGNRKRKRNLRKKKKKSRTLKRMRREELDKYYMETFYGAASAMIAYEMSKDSSKDTNDLLWLAIVGLTSYYVHGNIDRSRYVQLLQDVQIEVSNKNGMEAKTMRVLSDATQNVRNSYNVDAAGGEGLDATQEDEATQQTTSTIVPVAEEGRIVSQFDYRFMLYRHWTLYESMLFSDYVATSMQLWTSKGKATLERFIAKMGIPLKYCKQKFKYMSERLKLRLKTQAEEVAKEFDLNEILFHTFSRQDGFSQMVSASDLVHITTALLECETVSSSASSTASSAAVLKTNEVQDAAATNVHDTEEESKRWIRRFNIAYDSLRGGKTNKAHARGLASAKQLQKVVFEMATAVIERSQVRNSGPFRYTLLQNLTASEARFFVQPRVLVRLAKFIVSAFREKGKWTDTRAKPYIICVPNESRGTHLVVGVMCPARFQVSKNYLGRAFREAAEEVEAEYKHDSFDAAVIEFSKTTQPSQFLSELHDTLSI